MLHTIHKLLLCLTGQSGKLEADSRNKTKIFKNCQNPMVFRDLRQGGFGILIFQKCQVDVILPIVDIPILSICCSIEGLNSHIHHLTYPNPTNIHTFYFNALRHLFQTSTNNSNGIWVLFMDVCKVWVPMRVYLSVQVLQGTANAQYWYIS